MCFQTTLSSHGAVAGLQSSSHWRVSFGFAAKCRCKLALPTTWAYTQQPHLRLFQLSHDYLPWDVSSQNWIAMTNNLIFLLLHTPTDETKTEGTRPSRTKQQPCCHPSRSANSAHNTGCPQQCKSLPVINLVQLNWGMQLIFSCSLIGRLQYLLAPSIIKHASHHSTSSAKNCMQ